MHSMLENMYCTKIATFIVLNETVKVLLTYGIWRIKDNKKYLKKYLKGNLNLSSNTLGCNSGKA